MSIEKVIAFCAVKGNCRQLKYSGGLLNYAVNRGLCTESDRERILDGFERQHLSVVHLIKFGGP